MLRVSVQAASECSHKLSPDALRKWSKDLAPSWTPVAKVTWPAASKDHEVWATCLQTKLRAVTLEHELLVLHAHQALQEFPGVLARYITYRDLVRHLSDSCAVT
jgi:hypothetical protein